MKLFNFTHLLWEFCKSQHDPYSRRVSFCTGVKVFHLSAQIYLWIFSQLSLNLTCLKYYSKSDNFFQHSQDHRRLKPNSQVSYFIPNSSLHFVDKVSWASLTSLSEFKLYMSFFLWYIFLIIFKVFSIIVSGLHMCRYASFVFVSSFFLMSGPQTKTKNFKPQAARIWAVESEFPFPPKWLPRSLGI